MLWTKKMSKPFGSLSWAPSPWGRPTAPPGRARRLRAAARGGRGALAAGREAFYGFPSAAGFAGLLAAGFAVAFLGAACAGAAVASVF